MISSCGLTPAFPTLLDLLPTHHELQLYGCNQWWPDHEPMALIRISAFETPTRRAHGSSVVNL